ncbi:hypothetical protein PT974_05620 [Cladobotryum mycophilum]|uniref:Uncharacterized protein n=1 Tax=Cladobotryum mycophilum TaxID=491253 RepID=A0ABR0SJ82_9HYPO
MAEINLPFRNVPPTWGQPMYTPATTIPDPIMATVAGPGTQMPVMTKSFNGMFGKREGEATQPVAAAPVDKPENKELSAVYRKLEGYEDRILYLEEAELDLQDDVADQKRLLREMRKTMDAQKMVLDKAQETLREQAKLLKEQDEVLKNTMHWITMAQVHGKVPVPSNLMYRKPQKDAQGAARAPSNKSHCDFCGGFHDWAYDCGW